MGEVAPIVPVEQTDTETVDSQARKMLAEIEARMLRLEKSLTRVARTQAKNLPIFKDVIARIGTMRESIHDHANALMRVEKIATDSAAVTTALSETVRVISATQSEVNDKLDTILGLFTHAKTWTGYAKKYGAKAAPFVLGIAVARGWVSAENGKNFLSIFGF